MEVFYLRDDGAKVRSYAYQSYRAGWGGQWMVGDTPLRDLKQITKQEWLRGNYGPEWDAAAVALSR